MSKSWIDEALAQTEQGRDGLAAEGRRQLPLADREQQVLDRIDRARRRRPKVREERITMSHGAGGKATQTLIEAVFLDAFRNPLLEPLEDAAALTVGGARIALTTDSYVVSPLFFPGGDIGDLAVNGTVNDLAVSGARPLYLSAGFILEEGFPVADLQRVTESMRAAAEAAGVHVVTGDTKVVQKGKADGCYINTAGVGGVRAGHRPGRGPGAAGRRHHRVRADRRPRHHDHAGPRRAGHRGRHLLGYRCLERAGGGPAGRGAPGSGPCATRPAAGVATILNEIAKAADVGVLAVEDEIPVRPEVRGASELLGIDPMYVACEGRLVAVVPGEDADRAVAALRAHPLGERAAVIGHVRAEQPGIVQLKTAFGGTRIVDLLVGDPLPRIC